MARRGIAHSPQEIVSLQAAIARPIYRDSSLRATIGCLDVRGFEIDCNDANGAHTPATPEDRTTTAAAAQHDENTEKAPSLANAPKVCNPHQPNDLCVRHYTQMKSCRTFLIAILRINMEDLQVLQRRG